MAVYKVKVATGDILKAGTNNSISITLVGSRGESRQTTIKHWFLPGTEKDLTVRCEQDLGPIVLVRLHKWRLFLEDAWFCKDVRVTAPDGTLYRFPCYQWLEGVITVEFREGSGKKLADDELEILREHRRRELKARQEAYQWKTFAEGWPRCLNVDSVLELDSNVRFSCVRATNFNGLLLFQTTSHLLAGFLLRPTSWQSLDEMRSIFSRMKGREIVPEYVAAHWREDDFFGYQFLNGNNPIVIRQCAALPAKFPVTPEMVADFLGGGTHLDKEMREGRIFIVDYDLLEDIPAGTIHGRQQYVAAPLCLLHQGADGLLRPVAIQLLIPHFHFTLHINTLARSVLINPGGVIDKSSGATYEGLVLLVQRGLEKVTYASLCLPHDIRRRGMTQIPNYRYRDDGMILWETIRRFVSAVVEFYYKEDAAVREDAELQAWVTEIFVNGFLSRTSSGIPSSLRTAAELGKFLTVVVFTCSVQHAAVNNGQYDLGAFIPNAPSSMRHPPPTAKGKTFLQHFLDTIPEADTTATILVALILLSSRLNDTGLLGHYPEERFTEAEPRRIIRTFRGELEEIRDLIEERNHAATLRYNDLSPLETENSVSI